MKFGNHLPNLHDLFTNVYVRDGSKEHQEFMDRKNEQRKQKRKGKSKESRE